MDQVCNEFALEVADREESHLSWHAAGSRCENSVIIAAKHSKCLLIESLLEHRNRGLRALRALLEILGSFFISKVIQVVNAVVEGLVALLETHDESGGDFALADLEETGNTEEILTRWVDPEVSQVKLVTNCELIDSQNWFQVDRSRHIEDGREFERLCEYNVESQMIDIWECLNVLLHCLIPLPTCLNRALVLDNEIIIVVLKDDILWRGGPDHWNLILVLELDYVAFSR